MSKFIEETIASAFWSAHESGKTDWWRMTAAVLKNRLLMLTDRQFKERDFGARSFLEFAARFPRLISVDTTTYPPEVELRSAGIRSDLWQAAIDYTRGSVHVWDPKLQRARIRVTLDSASLSIPTITKEDVALWRRELAQRQRWLSGSQSHNIELWVESGRITRSLPEFVKSTWQRELSAISEIAKGQLAWIT